MSKILEKEFLEIEGVGNKLQDIANKHGFTVEDLLNVIQKESGFDTSAVNPSSKATGLIQFIPSTAEDLGTDTDAIYNMSALEQLDLIDKYFARNHTKGEHPYITIAYPAAAKMDMDDIIATSDDSIAIQNPVWRNKEGVVTKRSILKYAGYTDSDQNTPDNKDPLRKVFDYVSNKKYYTAGDYEKFKQDFSTKEMQDF